MTHRGHNRGHNRGHTGDTQGTHRGHTGDTQGTHRVSESQFKTQKYQPDYPGRFDHPAHARHWCEEYFDWYNVQHHHSGLAGYTPEQVFTGRYRDVAQAKQRALDVRYAQNPERFVKGCPKVPLPPTSVAINPIGPGEDGAVVDDRVNFPTLTAAGYVKSMLSSK